MSDDARRAAERSAREHYGRLLSILAASARDIVAAEDALADALAAALRDWPAKGVPASPEAWLLTVARRRLVDGVRRRQSADAALEQLAWLSQGAEPTGPGFPDARLKLLFVCAHPAIDPSVRAPLMLQTVLGFTAEEVAPFFLVSAASMSQRLVRAKRKLRDAGVAFRIPEPEELPDRLDVVLEAIYALFTQGWATSFDRGEQRRELASEALWLARLTAELCPDQPEALGLQALILHAWARDGARRDGEGAFTPLSQQDTTRWDDAMIEEAEHVLLRAARLGRLGRFQLEGAIQSAHAARRRTGLTDWRAILSLYDALCALAPSPAAEVNRCVALSHVEGPGAALARLSGLSADPRLHAYQPYWAALADLSGRTGDQAAARAAYDRAIALQPDPAVRTFLADRRDAIGAATTGTPRAPGRA